MAQRSQMRSIELLELQGETAGGAGELQAGETQSAAISKTIAQRTSQHVTQGIQSLSRTYPRSSFRVARPESWRAAYPSIRTSAADHAKNRWRSTQHWRCVLTKRQQSQRKAQSRDPWAIPLWNWSTTNSDLCNLHGSRHTGKNLVRVHPTCRCSHRHCRERETCNCMDDRSAVPAAQQPQSANAAPSNDHGERNTRTQRETSRSGESGVLQHNET